MIFCDTPVIFVKEMVTLPAIAPTLRFGKATRSKMNANGRTMFSEDEVEEVEAQEEGAEGETANFAPGLKEAYLALSAERKVISLNSARRTEVRYPGVTTVVIWGICIANVL